MIFWNFLMVVLRGILLIFVFCFFSRGSPESARIAQQLITALIKEPEKELSEILMRCGINRVNSSMNSVMTEGFRTSTLNNPSLSTTAQVSLKVF